MSSLFVFFVVFCLFMVSVQVERPWCHGCAGVYVSSRAPDVQAAQHSCGWQASCQIDAQSFTWAQRPSPAAWWQSASQTMGGTLSFSFCLVAFRCCSMSQLSCHASFTIVPLLELSIVGHWPEVSEGCCQVSKRSRSGMGAGLASSCSWLCRWSSWFWVLHGHWLSIHLLRSASCSKAASCWAHFKQRVCGEFWWGAFACSATWVVWSRLFIWWWWRAVSASCFLLVIVPALLCCAFPRSPVMFFSFYLFYGFPWCYAGIAVQYFCINYWCSCRYIGALHGSNWLHHVLLLYCLLYLCLCIHCWSCCVTFPIEIVWVWHGLWFRFLPLMSIVDLHVTLMYCQSNMLRLSAVLWFISFCVLRLTSFYFFSFVCLGVVFIFILVCLTRYVPAPFMLWSYLDISSHHCL